MDSDKNHKNSDIKANSKTNALKRQIIFNYLPTSQLRRNQFQFRSVSINLYFYSRQIDFSRVMLLLSKTKNEIKMFTAQLNNIIKAEKVGLVCR